MLGFFGYDKIQISERYIYGVPAFLSNPRKDNVALYLQTRVAIR